MINLQEINQDIGIESDCCLFLNREHLAMLLTTYQMMDNTESVKNIENAFNNMLQIESYSLVS